MRPIAARHGLTLLQLACQWNLAHGPVACVAPTLIQEPGLDARAVEDKRAELAAVSAEAVLTPAEVAEIRAAGDNTGSMLLKGAAPDHEGAPQPDRWALTPELTALAGRWGIDPRRDLAKVA
jgi:Ser/Thr protein kinase RdoA (MazF antagonist)